MIKSVEITNFRGVGHVVIDFASRISIIKGFNALGKSTIINALNWMLTDSLFSDAEDIIDSKGKVSIKPINYQKGDVVEVKIATEGKTFTKQFKAVYKKNSDELSTHKTEYKMNDVKIDNANNFYEELYKELNYKPAIALKDIREVNLLIDPLYALLKLDPKRLRALLVELGCNIENEDEFIKTRADWFVASINNYRGVNLLDKCLNMKVSLKAKAKELQKSIDTSTALLEKYKDVSEDTNNTALDIINLVGAKRDDLISRVATINSQNNTQVNELFEQLMELTAQKTKLMQAIDNDKTNKRKAIETQYQLAKNSLVEDFNEKLERWQRLENQLLKIKNDVEMMLKNNALSNDNKQQELGILDIQLKNYIQLKSTEMIRLDEHKQTKFNGMHTCPVCLTEFTEDQKALETFESTKEKLTKDYLSNIEYFALKEQETQQRIAQIKEDIQALAKQKIELDRQFLEFKTSYSEFIANNPKPDFKDQLVQVELERKAKLEEVANAKYPEQEQLAVITPKIEELDNQIKLLKTNDEEFRKKAKADIQEEISKCDLSLSKAWESTTRWKTKCDVLDEQNKTIITFNNVDQQIVQVSDIIKEIITAINAKALALVGIKFVLIEENISNDGYTEVCYATDENGVRFEHINSKEKLFFGLTFCEKIRNMLQPNCKLPYLVDKLEQLGDIQELATIECYQLIGTKVSPDKELVMQYLE